MTLTLTSGTQEDNTPIVVGGKTLAGRLDEFEVTYTDQLHLGRPKISAETLAAEKETRANMAAALNAISALARPKLN